MNAMLEAMVGPDRIRKISRREYDRMAEAGILGEDERLELLRGVIVHKNRHSESGPVVIEGIRLDDIRKLSRRDYYRMAEVGILGHAERVELIHGLVVAMSPMSELHSYLVVWLTRAFIASSTIRSTFGRKCRCRPRMTPSQNRISRSRLALACTRNIRTRRSS